MDNICDEDLVCTGVEATKKEFTVSQKTLNTIHRVCFNSSSEVLCECCSLLKYYRHTETDECSKRIYNYTSASKEHSSAHTMSSFICCECSRGSQAQKVQSGKFVFFGRIHHFIQHTNNRSISHQFAYVKWYDGLLFDCATGLWCAHYSDSDRSEGAGRPAMKYSYVLTKNLSPPLVTAIDNSKIWFLNSDKLPFNED